MGTLVLGYIVTHLVNDSFNLHVVLGELAKVTHVLLERVADLHRWQTVNTHTHRLCQHHNADDHASAPTDGQQRMTHQECEEHVGAEPAPRNPNDILKHKSVPLLRLSVDAPKIKSNLSESGRPKM